MAKMTIDGIKTSVAALVDATKQANPTYTPTYDDVTGMLDKIGKQVTLVNQFSDLLSVFDGEELPLGKNIEEYYMDLTMPEADDSSGDDENVPNRPTFENIMWSYPLAKQRFKTTRDIEYYNGALLTSEGLQNLIAGIESNLEASDSVYKYFAKKQLIGRYCDAIVASGHSSLVTEAAKPVDTSTGEAFVKSIKLAARTMSFPKDNQTINQNLTQIEKSGLVLILDSSIEPVIDVDVLAGAFNQENLAYPVEIIYIDEFLDSNGAYALMCDRRAIRLHPVRNFTLQGTKETSAFMNIVRHKQYTGFLSKNAVCHVWHPAA